MQPSADPTQMPAASSLFLSRLPLFSPFPHCLSEIDLENATPFLVGIGWTCGSCGVSTRRPFKRNFTVSSQDYGETASGTLLGNPGFLCNRKQALIQKTEKTFLEGETRLFTLRPVSVINT